MARIRSIKPEFWRSPSTAKASPRARLLYIAMWSWADDYGVGEWTPRELLGFAFPNDEEVTRTEFQCLCTEVAECFGTQFYLIKGRRFYYIPAWDDHQKNERRAQGKYPRPDAPDATVDAEVHLNAEAHGTSVQRVGSTASGTGEQGNREQGTGEQKSSSPAVTESLFGAVWAHWPKKVERKKALDQFKRAAKKMNVEVLADHVTRFGDAYAATTDRQFVPALGVWLNGERWTDELPRMAAPSNGRPTPEQRAYQTMSLAMDIDMKEIGQ